jgi:OHCU decarboxylase
VTLSELNARDRSGFVEAIGWVFEHSPWVAERAWTRGPFSTLDELHAAMIAQVAEAGPDEQLALLRAHPDLGTRAAMTEVSTSEQAAAGLGDLTPEEFERFHALNDAYRTKFGFPFVYAVRGSTKGSAVRLPRTGPKRDILRALGARLSSTRQAELAEALGQVCRIARFRLEDVIS